MENKFLKFDVLSVVVHILCLAGWYGWVLITTRSHLLDDPLLYYYIYPVCLSALNLFIMNIIFPSNTTINRASKISIPGTLVYLSVYIIIPLVVEKNFTIEFIPTFCFGMIPMVILFYIFFSFSIWLGAVIRIKFFHG